MKQGWEIKKIGEVVQKIFAGGDKPHMFSEQQTDICCVPVYGNGVTNEGLCGYTDHYVVNERCLTVSARGTVGYCCVRNEPFVPIVRLITIIPQESIGVEFLCYVLSTINIENNGVAIPQLTVPMIKNVSIPVPPLAEQEKIVAELDCLSGIIEKKKQQLKELDNLAQSIFYEMFGDPVENDKRWKTINIENICSSIVRGPFGSALKKEFFVEQAPTTYKVYEQKHAIQKSVDIGTYFIDTERFQTLKRFEVVPGDIIMSCSGTIGEFFVIPEGAERGIINQALLKYTLNDSIDQTYFLYVMEWVKENFDKKGTGLQNIGSVGTIKKTKISFPPLALQQDFASKIESIEKQKELIAQSIKETETLFNSRMDYYFN